MDLSNNLIEFIPEEFSSLPCLQELNISHNQFGKSSPKQWNWMAGPVAKSLKYLNVSYNELKFLPDQLVKLHNLITLNVDNNQLQVLPSGIGNLTNLKIFTASQNNIKSLPGSVKKWQLQALDLSHNSFDPNIHGNPAAIFPKPLPVLSLLEYASSRVLQLRLPYTPETLPVTVIKYLSLAKYCVCGKAVFDVYIKHPHMLLLSSIATSLSVSFGDLTYVPMDCYFCSLKCFSSTNYSRNRNPVIR